MKLRSSPIYILKRRAWPRFSARLDGYDINMFVRRTNEYYV